jgi:hypothetical protein
MNRRSFLKFAGGAVAGIALDQAIPNGRVWSFPSEVKVWTPFELGGQRIFPVYNSSSGLPHKYVRYQYSKGVIRCFDISSNDYREYWIGRAS